MYFDWWIHNHTFKPYLKKFAAYYYNRAAQWGKEVTINYKHEAFAPTTAVFDVERGALGGISPLPWQTDTAIAKNSWGYTEGNESKSSRQIVGDLVDIVSKNGNLLLNIGPKPDGTLSKRSGHDFLIEDVTLLGSKCVTEYERTEDALIVKVNKDVDLSLPICFKIKIG